MYSIEYLKDFVHKLEQMPEELSDKKLVKESLKCTQLSYGELVRVLCVTNWCLEYTDDLCYIHDLQPTRTLKELYRVMWINECLEIPKDINIIIKHITRAYYNPSEHKDCIQLLEQTYLGVLDRESYSIFSKKFNLNKAYSDYAKMCTPIVNDMYEAHLVGNFLPARYIHKEASTYSKYNAPSLKSMLDLDTIAEYLVLALPTFIALLVIVVLLLTVKDLNQLAESVVDKKESTIITSLEDRTSYKSSNGEVNIDRLAKVMQEDLAIDMIKAIHYDQTQGNAYYGLVSNTANAYDVSQYDIMLAINEILNSTPNGYDITQAEFEEVLGGLE